MQRRIVQIIDAELHEHQVGLVGHPHVLEQSSLRVGVVSADSEVHHLDAGLGHQLGQPGFEYLGEGVLFRDGRSEGQRVAEHDDPPHAFGLGPGVESIAEAVGVHPVADSARLVEMARHPRPHAVEPGAVRPELVEFAALAHLGGSEQPESHLDDEEAYRHAERCKGDPRAKVTQGVRLQHRRPRNCGPLPSWPNRR